LLTVAEVCALLQIRKSIVYAACDRGELQYVKFEGAVQIEGRDLKRWFGNEPRRDRSEPG
jgi:excisionase family DNA binding protein